MDNRTLTALTAVMLIGIAALFVVNLFPMFWNPATQKHLSPGDVRGMALIHKQTPWTLNFDQQNHVIKYMNMAIPIAKDKTHLAEEKIPLDSLVVYRFNASDVTLTPIGFQDNDVVFSIPEWNKTGYIKDVSGGELKKLLLNAFDK